ncbi:MAG: hypothetical protein H7257_01375 [Taibaiella sp.]|nr:hypothetical protein [Taibaiella sp.]
MFCNQVLKKGSLFIAFSLLLFTACKKTESNPLSDADDNGGYASDASHIEWLNNDAISIADAAGNFYNGVYMRTTNTFGACAIVAPDTLHSPHIITIYFGDVNCKCADGRNRRGNIIISYDSTYNKNGQTHTITFDHYYVNDVQLAGNVKVTRVDTTIVGNWYYKVKVDESMVTTPNQIIYWQGTLVRKWVSGYATGERGDNIFSISGVASLTRANGHKYVFNIATPLQFALDCDYCQSGVVDIAGYSGSRQLDYSVSNGSAVGQCDNVAKLNITGRIYPLKLKY